MTNNRPNIQLGNCLATQSGSQFNIVVTPSGGVSIPATHTNINIPLPAAGNTVCYTIKLVNPLGNCSKDTVICVRSTQGVTVGSLGISSLSVCPNETITINAIGALATHTLIYTDNVGTQTTTLSSATFSAPATIGAYTYTLLVNGKAVESKIMVLTK